MRRFLVLQLALGLGALAALSGCPTRDVSDLSPHEETQVIKSIPITTNRNVDLLFMVDNSLSMAEEQTSLLGNFPNFITVLEGIKGGLPNIHIGVISSNVGIGGYSASGCTGAGDNGKLQATARISGCTPPGGPFISDITDESGTHVTNYTGSLGDTFSCIAKLGTSGCGL
jgi:hypothetical protein